MPAQFTDTKPKTGTPRNNPAITTSQNFLIECNAPFGDGPQVKVSFMGGSGPAQIVARLPLNPSKFFAPLVTDGGDFFRRWKLFEGKELQKIFKLKTAPLAEPEVERVCAGRDTSRTRPRHVRDMSHRRPRRPCS